MEHGAERQQAAVALFAGPAIALPDDLAHGPAHGTILVVVAGLHEHRDGGVDVLEQAGPRLFVPVQVLQGRGDLLRAGRLGAPL